MPGGAFVQIELWWQPGASTCTCTRTVRPHLWRWRLDARTGGDEDVVAGAQDAERTNAGSRQAPSAVVTVLIVDDDEEFRRSTGRLLVDRGFGAIEAANADHARTILGGNDDVAALLCDVRMPGESGLDLLTHVRDDYPDVAVVMTTGVDDPGVAGVAFGAGAFGYLVKPFDENELLINLAGALTRRDLEMANREHLRSVEATISRSSVLENAVIELTSGSTDDGAEVADTIERLSRAVSLRDEETARHLERMSRYSVLLAEAVGYTRLPLGDLRLVAALHDVGKIGVPDGILLKPARLTGDEYGAMQRHAQLGYQLLFDSSHPLLTCAADVALAHHEWWDGTGYPRGLQGEEISVEARIVAVADVFDALTSHRVYRPAMSFAEGISVMSELRGRQFEPRLLDALLERIDEVGEIRAAYPDKESAKRIRVLVVDDQEMFAQSLSRLLATRSELKVVGTADSVSSAVSSALAYQPDVVLMDFALPDGDGTEATAKIKALRPAMKVIMLTSRTDGEPLERAVAAGCSGFVTKSDPIDALFEAIVAVNEGDIAADQAVLATLLRRLRPTRLGIGSDLTGREREVLALSAAGLVNKEIAQRLDVRLNTVRNHMQKILYKLHVHSKLEAVAVAVREGVIAYPG